MSLSGRRCWAGVGLVMLALLASGTAYFALGHKQPEKGSPPEIEDWFEDVTDRVGIQFVHDAGDPSKLWQPQIHGSGVAVFDFDGDGRPDIYFLTFGGPESTSTNRLYKNMPDNTFKDVTAGSGLGIGGYNTGVAVGDVNNDGWPDLLVTQHGGVKLFINNGDGTFTDRTEESGLKNPLWGCSACFFDYDRDGLLDLVLVNYLDDDPNWRCYNTRNKRDYCGPRHFTGTVTKLFHNLGPKGQPEAGKGQPVTFKDVTVESGLARLAGPGLAVYCADFTGDGWPDILIVNDNSANYLWVNQHDGTFTEEAVLRGIALDGMGQALAGMGIAIGDVDGDGLFDAYMTHLNTERNTLWMQSPRGHFQDRTNQYGLTGTSWHATGFGTLMADFDQDGWIDIAVANGGVALGTNTPNPALGEHFSQYSERNQLFRNLGQGRFQDVSQANPVFCGTPNIARGLATADFDGDGALDLVITTVASRARVFRNVAPRRGHWLMVRAIDPRLKRDAYGAEVRVQSGERRWLRIVNPCDSYQSSSDPRAHFGLGELTSVDSIRILWPDGLAEVFAGGSVDRQVVLRRGEGQKESGAKSK